jgi:hypothetical protein
LYIVSLWFSLIPCSGNSWSPGGGSEDPEGGSGGLGKTSGSPEGGSHGAGGDCWVLDMNSS